MSPPIRPLPLEAAPQRTEDDAVALLQEDLPEFGEVLDSHLEDEEEAGDEPEASPEKKSTLPSVEPWSLFGAACINLQFLQPPPEQNEAEASFSGGSNPLSTAGTVLSGDTLINEQPNSEVEGKSASKGELPPEMLAGLRPCSSEQKVPTPPVPEPQTEQIAGETAKNGEKSHGIVAAKQPPMLLTGQMHDEAPSTKEAMHLEIQNFEATGFEQPIKVQEIYSRQEKPALPEKKSEQVEFVPAHLFSREAKAAVTTSQEVETPQTSNVSALATVQSINGHVALFRASNQNELKVVLRPDANTELFLHITKTDGQIHVQARCERGDFAWLGAHWGAVQNALSAQGVQVEPLQPAYQMGDRSNSQLPGDQQPPQRENTREPLDFGTDQEFPQPQRSSTPSLSRPRVRGWQSWA